VAITIDLSAYTTNSDGSFNSKYPSGNKPEFSLTSYALDGAKGTLPTAGNNSGVYYIPDTDIIGITKNNSTEIDEYALSDLSAIIRTIDIAGVNSPDLEGLCWMGNNEFCASGEGGGTYIIYIFDYPPTGTGPMVPKQVLTIHPATGTAETNSGLEGVCYDPVNEVFYAVGEGQQSLIPRKFFKVERPTNTTTDYDYNDPELVVTEPFDAETALPGDGSTLDLSGITFHVGSGHVVISSDTGSKLIHLDPNGDGTILSEFALEAGNQWEGVSFTSNNGLLCISEPNYYQKLEYTI
jgi:uncharacterized protein YjiK